MAMRQEDWHELYEAAERDWGANVAGTLMNLLPPVGWADVATKRDLDSLEVRFESLENKLKAEFRKEINRLTWVLRLFRF